MRKVSTAVVLVALACVPAFATSIVTPLFGSRVVENARFKVPYATLDFDGDGQADAVYLVSIAKASATAAIASDVKVISTLFYSQPLGAREEKLALAVLLAKDKQKFLFTGYEGEGVSDFFASPSWNEKDIPLSVAKRGSQAFRDFQAQEKRIKNDILVVGTEAGIDTALYWNGKTFVWFEPIEEP